MSTTSTAYCQECKKVVYWGDSVSGPITNNRRYRCMGELRNHKFINGAFVGGDFGLPESEEQVDTLSWRIGSSDSGVYIPAVIGDRRVTLFLGEETRRKREEAVDSDSIEGLVPHKLDPPNGDIFFVCEEDAKKLGYKCNVCGDRLLYIGDPEYVELRRLQEQEFMRRFFPALIGQASSPPPSVE
jgi:DNA-directed RNA polymerase subunit RPC12/RpoP